MALFAKYYITSPWGVYIDWSSRDGFSLLNEEGAIRGGDGDDYVSVGAGNSFDATDLMTSLGNAIRISKPFIIIDEIHKVFSENARKTI